MFTLQRRRKAPGSPLALLLAYLCTGALGGVAHGSERFDAPVRVESTRHERCPTMHDASACALCSYSHAAATAATGNAMAIPLPPPRSWQLPPVDGRRSSPAALTRHARGPPPLLA